MTGELPEPVEVEENDHGKVVKKKCPCGQWVSNRGYNSHARFCTDYETDGENNMETVEAESGPNSENEESVKIMPDCDQCGEQLYYTEDAASVYRKAGYPNVADQIESFDYYCDNCTTEEQVAVCNEGDLK